ELATSSRDARAPAIGPTARTERTSPNTASPVGMAVIATRITKIRRRKGSAILVKQSMESAGVRQFDTGSGPKEPQGAPRSNDAQPYPLPLVQHQAAPGNHRHHGHCGGPGDGLRGSGGDGAGFGDAHLGVGIRERP